MTPANTPAETTVQTSTLGDKILTDLEIASQVLASSGSLIPGIGLPVSIGAAITAKLLAIIEGARAAHKQILGQPLDMTLLKDEPPV